MKHFVILIAKFGVSFLVIYALAVIFLFLTQKSAIYYPGKQDFNSCNAFSDSQKIKHNGTRMYFKMVSEKLVVVYHGNAGSACDRAFLKDTFEEKNYSYIFVEYSGYSNDDKKPSKEGILKDVESVKDFIEKNNFKKIVLFGESLGSGPASYHSTLRKADKIILVEPFDSILNFAKSRYPFFPVKMILTEDFDNVKWLKDFNGSVLIIHGEKDDIMPIQRPKNLYDSINSSRKKFVEVKGAGHNDIYSYDETIKSIKDALT